MIQTTNDRRRTKSTRIPFLLSVVCCLLFIPLLADAYIFARDLKLGDVGEDVQALQTKLNADPRTRIAESGPGSPGYETAVFGDKTHAAVIRYQNLNTKDILEPIGLRSGTGYVGAATRKRLNGINADTMVGESDSNKAISAFDAALGISDGQKTGAPVDDPRIPKTQEELFASVGEFAGDEATEEEIKDFSTNMILARYGYTSSIAKDDNGADDGTKVSQAKTGDENKSSGDTGAGCMALLFALLGL